MAQEATMNYSSAAECAKPQLLCLSTCVCMCCAVPGETADLGSVLANGGEQALGSEGGRAQSLSAFRGMTHRLTAQKPK